MKPLQTLVLFLTLVSLAGCGPRPPKLVRVKGTVLYGGKPFGQGLYLSFVAEDGESGHTASAVTDNDSSFTPLTVPHGQGIMPGSYRVVVATPTVLAAKYTNFETTPLRAEIPPEGTDQLVIKIPKKSAS